MSGYTLLETMIVVSLMGGMSFLLNMTLQTTWSTDDFLKAQGAAKTRAEKLTYQISSLIGESRHIYAKDEEGLAYLAACRLALPPAAGVRLPVFDPRADLYADEADAPFTGNMLLFVREINASPCVANPETGKQRYIDTYRMIAVYPTLADQSIVIGQKQSRDLVIWRSVSFPSVRQILEIGVEDERKSIIGDLVERYGFSHAWDPNEPLVSAFYALDGNGSVAAQPTPDFHLDEDDVLSEGGRLVYGRCQLSGSEAEGEHIRRAVLSSDNAADWQPNGFEVKIGGPSGSRKIWLHLVVESPTRDGRRLGMHSTTTVVHARDF